MTGMGNEVQARAIAEQVADAAIARFDQTHPHVRNPAASADIPAPLKWAAGLVVAIMSAGAVAMAMWIVSTLSGLQQTVTRIDERQQITGGDMRERLDRIDARVSRIEQGAGGAVEKHR